MALDPEPLQSECLDSGTPYYACDAEKTRPPTGNIDEQNETHRIYPLDEKESADVWLHQQARWRLDISQIATAMLPSIVPSGLRAHLESRHVLRGQHVYGTQVRLPRLGCGRLLWLAFCLAAVPTVRVTMIVFQRSPPRAHAFDAETKRESKREHRQVMIRNR